MVITEADLEAVVSLHAKLQKRILFLIILYTKRYGSAHLAAQRIARHTGGSTWAVQKALSALESSGYIEKRTGHVVYSKTGFVSAANTYVYRHPVISCGGKDIEIKWDFKEDSFIETYLDTIRGHIAKDRWRELFTKKELEELNDGQV